jgi:energy-coupling factor transporter ATP-binding protein EcfA2
LREFLAPRIASRKRILAWEDAIFALAAGDPQVVLLSGPAGCGKSTLLLQLARTLIESGSGVPAYLRISPGEHPTAEAIWEAIRARAGSRSVADLADACNVRVLLDAEGLNYVEAAALARALRPPEGIAAWVAVRTLRPTLEWGQPLLGASTAALPPPPRLDGAPDPGDDGAFEAWSWAPPAWNAISFLLRRRKQPALLARLADGEASWALRDPFLLGLVSHFFAKRHHVPAQPGPLLDALASEIAGGGGADRGRQVLVSDLLPAFAAALEVEGSEEWPDHRFRYLAFEVGKNARLPLRPQDLAAAGVASEVLVRRGHMVAFCHPTVRETFAAWDLTSRVTRSGTGPLLTTGKAFRASGPIARTRSGTSPLPGAPGELTKRIPAAQSGPLGIGRSPQPAMIRLSDGMATRLVARIASHGRLHEVYDLLTRQGRWAPLAQGLTECKLPEAASLRAKLLGSCRALLGGEDDPREVLRNPRAGWFEEPLAALVALGGSQAYEAVRDGMAQSLMAFSGGLEACGLAGSTFVAAEWTLHEPTVAQDSPEQVLSYLDMERPFLRAAARALRYLDGNRFVAEMAEGRLPPPVVRALLWDSLGGDVPRILSGPCAQVGAGLLDAREARAWPTWIMQTLPDPWGVSFLCSLGALAGPAGDPVAYLGWPPRRSEGFISVIQGLWHQSLSAVARDDRTCAGEALEGLLETFAATWDAAPEGSWDAIPGRPVGRLAHFFLALLHRHVGERESLRASRGLNAALLACEPENLDWYLARLREVLRVDRAGCLSPRQARLLGVALRFIQVRDKRLATLFGRTPSRAVTPAGAG